MRCLTIPLVSLLSAGLAFSAAEDGNDTPLSSEYRETATVRERLLSSPTASARLDGKVQGVVVHTRK